MAAMKTAASNGPNMRAALKDDASGSIGFSPRSSTRSATRLVHRVHRGLWGIAVLYLAVGLAWTVGGDLAIAHLFAGSRRLISLQLASSAAFLVVTAIALRWLLSRLARTAIQAHERLAASEAGHRQMFHANPSPMLVYELDALRVIDVNPAAVSFFGWSRDQLIGMTLQELWPPSDRDGLDPFIAAARADPDQLCLSNQTLRLQDGRRRMVEIRSAGVDYQGAAARLIVITDRQMEYDANRRRDQALQRLEEAQTIAQLGSWELDPATGLCFFSGQIYQMLDRAVPPADRRHHHFDALLEPADMSTRSRVHHILRGLRRRSAPRVDRLLEVRTATGRPRTFHLRAEWAPEEHTPCIRGTLQDVTEYEQSRRLLHEREEQFRELVRVLPDGVAILRQEQVLYVNSACASQLGHTNESLLGEDVRTLVAPEDVQQVHAQICATGPDDDAGTTARMRRRDGSVFQAGLSFGQVRYDGADCKLMIMRDLSEPERMRDALAASNDELHAMARRLFSLQEDERRAISRDLHDDIGQAITAMKLSALAALDETDLHRRNHDLQELVSLADASVTKLRNLSTLLRPPQLDALGLEAALRWQAGMLFRASSVRLQMDIRPLPARPTNEIEQACFRIAQESLTNALRHACAGEVQLTLRDDPAGQQLCLEVTDDGDGFDPGGPRGLGLIVMRERAQSAGGALQIDSAPGAGTRVMLQLPYVVATPTDMLEH